MDNCIVLFSGGPDVHCLQALAAWALAHFKFHRLAVAQGSIAVHLDRGLVDKDFLLAILTFDKTEPALAVEPFYYTVLFTHLPSLF